MGANNSTPCGVGANESTPCEVGANESTPCGFILCKVSKGTVTLDHRKRPFLLKDMELVVDAMNEYNSLRGPWAWLLHSITIIGLSTVKIDSAPNGNVTIEQWFDILAKDPLSVTNEPPDGVTPTLINAARDLHSGVVLMQAKLEEMCRLIELVSSFYLANGHICGMGFETQQAIKETVEALPKMNLALLRAKWTALVIIMNAKVVIDVRNDVDRFKNMSELATEAQMGIPNYELYDDADSSFQVFHRDASSDLINPKDEMVQMCPLWIPHALPVEFLKDWQLVNESDDQKIERRVRFIQGSGKSWLEEFYSKKRAFKFISVDDDEEVEVLDDRYKLSTYREAEKSWTSRLCQAYRAYRMGKTGKHNGLKFERFLSNGAFGDVHLCTKDGDMFVVKIMEGALITRALDELFWKEVDASKLLSFVNVSPGMMKRFGDHNLIREYKTGFEWKGKVSRSLGPKFQWGGYCSMRGRDKIKAIALEYIEGKTLASYVELHSVRENLTIASVWNFLSTFGEAMIFVLLRLSHEYRITHNDLHGNNVMITKITRDVFDAEGVQCGCFIGLEDVLTFHRIIIIDVGLCSFSDFKEPIDGHILRPRETKDFFRVFDPRDFNATVLIDTALQNNPAETSSLAAQHCFDWLIAWAYVDLAIRCNTKIMNRVFLERALNYFKRKRNTCAVAFESQFVKLQQAAIGVLMRIEKMSPTDIYPTPVRYAKEGHLGDVEGITHNKNKLFAPYGNVFSLKDVIPYKIAPSLYQ